MRAALLAVLVAAVAGCGGDSREGARPAATTAGSVAATTPDSCHDAGRHGAVGYRLCFASNRGDHGRLYADEDGRSTLVRVDPPYRASGQPLIGHWRRALLSPDGGWFLLEWSAECEVPFTFVVRSGGGTPRPALGQPRRWGKAEPSTAVGWRDERTALVRTHSDCGGPEAGRLVRVRVDR